MQKIGTVAPVVWGDFFAFFYILHQIGQTCGYFRYLGGGSSQDKFYGYLWVKSEHCSPSVLGAMTHKNLKKGLFFVLFSILHKMIQS